MKLNVSQYDFMRTKWVWSRRDFKKAHKAYVDASNQVDMAGPNAYLPLMGAVEFAARYVGYLEAVSTATERAAALRKKYEDEFDDANKHLLEG
jgi:hypothetical protein